jgi:hypothetical protein
MPKERPDYELGPEQEKMYNVFDMLDHELKTANEYLSSKTEAWHDEAGRLVGEYRRLREEEVPDLKDVYDLAADMIEFDRQDDYRSLDAQKKEQFAEIAEEKKDALAANERIKERRLAKMEGGGEFWDKVSYGVARFGNWIFSTAASYSLLNRYAKGAEEFAVGVLGASIVWGEYAIGKWKDKKKKQVDIDFTSHLKRIKREAHEGRAKASEWLSGRKDAVNIKAQKKRRKVYRTCFDQELPGDIAADADRKMEDQFALEDRPMERALEQSEPGPKAMLARARSYQRRLKKEVKDKHVKTKD